MRTIIAGSRTVTDPAILVAAIRAASQHKLGISRVISGGARGADALGEAYARAWGLPLSIFPADWERHGIYAGRMRNDTMAKAADALLALWDGHSRGTAHMIDSARKHQLLVVVYYTQTGVVECHDERPMFG